MSQGSLLHLFLYLRNMSSFLKLCTLEPAYSHLCFCIRSTFSRPCLNSTKYEWVSLSTSFTTVYLLALLSLYRSSNSAFRPADALPLRQLLCWSLPKLVKIPRQVQTAKSLHNSKMVILRHLLFHKRSNSNLLNKRHIVLSNLARRYWWCS